jgi:hypothetical protein
MQTLGTSYEYMRTLKITHKAMLIGNIIFCMVFTIIVNNTSFVATQSGSFNTVGMVIAPVITIIGIIYGNWLFKKKIDAILQSNTTTLSQKLIPYKAASLLRWAIAEMPLILCNVFLFLTGSYYYIIFIFIVLIFFILYTPSKEQIAAHLQLSTDEQLVLEQEYEEIN